MMWRGLDGRIGGGKRIGGGFDVRRRGGGLMSGEMPGFCVHE
jgi:hypothetical protein